MAIGVSSRIPVLATVWIVGWLLARWFHGDGPAPVRKVLLAAHRVLAVLPLVWLALVAALVLRAYLRIGEWPQGSGLVGTGHGWPEWREANIDPATFGIHTVLATAMGLAVLASPLFFLPVHAVAGRSSSRRRVFWLTCYIAGFTAFVLLSVVELGGVAEWLDG